MKIGLPRALMHYYYHPYWKTFFETLGIETVLSDVTSTGLAEKGIKITVSEICLPIKLFNAHVINLLEKGVDYVFVPRYVSVVKGNWLCPKYLGLPELVKYTVPGAMDKVVSMDIYAKEESLGNLKDYDQFLKTMHLTRSQVKKAAKAAQETFLKFREICKKGYTFYEAEDILYNNKKIPLHNDGEITIGVLGYVYNIYDPLISMDMVKKLRDMNVRIMTFDMLDEPVHERSKEKEIYWTFTNKMQHTAEKMLEDNMVDGLIHVTAFVCGLDSVLGKTLDRLAEQYNKPLMVMRVDEHTGESHLQTRIEAFTDMLKRKKLAQRKLAEPPQEKRGLERAASFGNA